MAKLIENLVKLPDLSNQEATNLTAVAAAGATSITVDSTEGFAANDYIIVGDPGTEGAEIVLVSGVTNGTTLAVGALSLAHSISTPVVKTPYNKAKVYRSDTESGSYAEITGSPFTLAADQLYTPFTDPTGTAAKWYKFTHYNSTSAAESSASTPVLGGAANAIMTLEDVKHELDIKVSDKNHDGHLIKVIDAVTAKIIRDTGVQYISKSVTDEYHDIDENQGKVFTDYFPIYGTPTVVDNGQTLTYNADPDATDFYLYAGYVESAIGAFFPGRKRFKISYTAYRAIESDLKQAAVEMAAILSGLKTRSYIDDNGESQSIRVTAIPQHIKDTIARYKRVIF
jgi:hypothetical protein